MRMNLGMIWCVSEVLTDMNCTAYCWGAVHLQFWKTRFFPRIYGVFCNAFFAKNFANFLSTFFWVFWGALFCVKKRLSIRPAFPNTMGFFTTKSTIENEVMLLNVIQVFPKSRLVVMGITHGNVQRQIVKALVGITPSTIWKFQVIA